MGFSRTSGSDDHWIFELLFDTNYHSNYFHGVLPLKQSLQLIELESSVKIAVE